ncbi:MAG: bifunctional heptose 7-phosphate kinase/heptose 1-phosphate adenyltransferase [Candidatus Aminicenantales bacterium]
MTPDRLEQMVRRFPECRVAVVGDFFLDKYLDTDPELAEISVESGKTAHQVVGIRRSPGAAGTIVNNLAALAAGQIHVLGVTGDDGEGYELRQTLGGLGCKTEGLIVVPGLFTPTYLKPRNCRVADLSGEHERYDTKNRRPTPREAEDKVLAHLESILPGLDAVAVQDQVEEEDCGIVTARVRERMAGLAGRHPGKIFWADSRSRIGLFRHFMIKVNAREAVRQIYPPGTDDPDDATVIKAMSELRKRTERPVFVTAGRRGMWVSDPEPALVRGVRVPEPTDPTGAGDSSTAGAVLALCAGASPAEAALVANLVASITVQQLATTGTARPWELGPRLEMWLEQG